MSKTKHGTHSCYVQGCRCDECKSARREYMRDYRARKANPSGRQHRCPSCTCQQLEPQEADMHATEQSPTTGGVA